MLHSNAARRVHRTGKFAAAYGIPAHKRQQYFRCHCDGSESVMGQVMGVRLICCTLVLLKRTAWLLLCSAKA